MTVRSCGLVPPQVRLTILTIFGASIVSAAVLRPQARLTILTIFGASIVSAAVLQPQARLILMRDPGARAQAFGQLPTLRRLGLVRVALAPDRLLWRPGVVLLSWLGARVSHASSVAFALGSSLDSQALSCFSLRMEGMIDATD